jgi:hypothetical protein
MSEDLHYAGSTYALDVAGDRPYLYLADHHGKRVAALFVLSSIHPMDGRDETLSTGEWTATEREGSTVFSLEVESSVWTRKCFEVVCRPNRFSYGVTVEGTGRLAEACYFGGYSSAWNRFGSGFFPSGHAFLRVFDPEPNAENVPVVDASGGVVIDLTGAPLPGKRHWFFTPAPFCFSLDTGRGWVGVGVECEAGENRFTEYRYHGGQGFYLSLAYEGHTEVRGSYRLPSIGWTFGESWEETLRAHVTSLRERDLVQRPRVDPAPWWYRPIFCGWGAQCELAARQQGYRGTDPIDPQPGAFLATMRRAADYARQDVYQEFLSALDAHELDPGTITIDDKWQTTYGENRADPEKWPDLRGFVDRQHGAGRHVLLWLKAWDIEGVPPDECITNAAGTPLTVDPTNPAYEARLRASVRYMLGADGYDADGFKIDFSHRIPSGPSMRTHGDAWGLELMRRLLEIVHDEAHRIKADALVITHTPHPYLADVLDMVRLNDMIDLSPLDGEEMIRSIEPVLRHRARVASIACPEAPIDTDNWPVRSKAFWREYVRLQPEFGVPSLYFATRIDLTQEPLDDDDYRLVRDTWERAPMR